jgi:hypothetical protein
LDALAALSDVDLAIVLEILSNIDAEQLLEDFAGALAGPESEDVWVRAFSILPPARQWPASTVVIHQLANLARHMERPLPCNVIKALRLVTEIRQDPDFRSFAKAIRSGSMSKLATALRPPTLAAIASLRPGTRIRLGKAMAKCISPERPCSNFTRFGGLLMLLPHIPQPDPDALPEGPGSRTGLVGLIALPALLGSAESAAALHDPVLRGLFAVDPRATLDDLAEWLGQIAPQVLPRPRRSLQGSKLPPAFSRFPEQNRRIREIGLAGLADFARRLPGLAAASLPFLKVNVFGVGASVTAAETGFRATLDRSPLDVLLSISGLADRRIALPDGQMLDLERIA